MKLTIIGQVSQIGQTVGVGENNFEIREVILKTVEEYPNFILVKFMGERVTLLNDFKVGDIVQVKANLKGREYTNDKGEYNVFMSVNGWAIDKAGVDE
ncbi:DUF3127 domain-containing protein [Tenacibaculum piscium]|uniref:DUF3127 domain-containing protein n=1 Tax=Tenacibaculum piscium TaxID=1458515 RepID=UPI001F41BBDA|nr:DUF3127 domain-containing protein [Tenacibaculum piscium]